MSDNSQDENITRQEPAPPYTPSEPEDGGPNNPRDVLPKPYDGGAEPTEQTPLIQQQPQPIPQFQGVNYNNIIPLETLGTKPGDTTCPRCQQKIRTITRNENGCCTYASSCLFLSLCCIGGLIPFFCDRFKDVVHSCPRCNGNNRDIARKNRCSGKVTVYRS